MTGVGDVGTLSDDPVFPLLDDPCDYLAPVRARRLLPALDRAAAWAISGFLGVVALAATSSLGPSGTPSRIETVVAAAEAPAGPLRADVVGVGSAAALLDTLPAHPAEATTVPAGASVPRPAWADRDGAGCDVRQKVLRRDLSEVRLAPGGCIVRSGVLRDPSTGKTVRYLRAPGERSSVALAAVVSQRDAWATGAAHLSAAARRALASDPLNLVAVSGTGRRTADLRFGTAQSPGWGSMARPVRCSYVARRIAVKARYRLWVTPAEQTALRDALRACPNQALPAADPGGRGIPASAPQLDAQDRGFSGGAGHGTSADGRTGAGR